MKITKTNAARLLDKAEISYELIPYEVDESEMIPMKELLPVTGYIRGACSPIGMKKLFPTFIHDTCRNFETIYVSAGQRGLQIRISPHDLILEVKAEIVSLLD